MSFQNCILVEFSCSVVLQRYSLNISTSFLYANHEANALFMLLACSNHKKHTFKATIAENTRYCSLKHSV